ncbi:hypothetical protein SK128_011205 [Halocaridina rubra]|uniref:Uncharacterized protein n=1 Tax=Halocaridina rubra TaxID=373956 RepID=A0AAN8ZXD7_HALRR
MGPNGVMQSVPYNSGFSGQMGFPGGHAGPMAYNNNGFFIASPNVPVNNQQLYALVPIQQQAGGQTSLGGFQLTATTTANSLVYIDSVLQTSLVIAWLPAIGTATSDVIKDAIGGCNHSICNPPIYPNGVQCTPATQLLINQGINHFSQNVIMACIFMIL